MSVTALRVKYYVRSLQVIESGSMNAVAVPASESKRVLAAVKSIDPIGIQC
jgi:hypothetical protein